MPTHSRATALLLVLVVSVSASADQRELVSGREPKAKPIYEAMRGLMDQIVAGDREKARAQFAGEGTDVELLDAYLSAAAAEKALSAAVDEKYGPDPDRSRGLGRGRLTHGVDVWGKSFEFNSVIFDGDTASCSATGPMGVGINFRKVDGRWKVRSLASRPNTPKAHLARLQAYTPAITRLTEGVKKGSFKTPDDALKAAWAAGETLWPREPAPSSRPSTRPRR